MNVKFLPFVWCLSSLFVHSSGLNLVTLAHCCELGTNYANTGQKCDSFQKPIAGVKPADESACTHSIEVCCKKRNENLQCQEGINDAKNAQTCSESPGFKRDCCDACQFGQDSKKSQDSCNVDLGLGPPYETAFKECCLESSSSSTSTSTTTTTTTIKSTTPSDSYDSLPPLDNVCDIGDLCAQICTPTQDSYRCECNKGFTLMSDGISCKPEKRALRKGDRCSINNPCDHDCIDTGVAIKCSCQKGYELADDKKSCNDIDECVLGLHECGTNELCVNQDGDYYCSDSTEPDFDLGSDLEEPKCPTGFKFNYDKQVCDDIDECEFHIICPRPKTCINTLGSFKCEGEDEPQCPPGFTFKVSIDTCIDIDECLTGENNCNKESQVCLNTKGNYTCVDKVSKTTCPAGFKKNPFTQKCDDIDECVENDNPCRPEEECVNEPGGHNCIAKTKNDEGQFEYPLRPKYSPVLPPRPTETMSTITETTVTTIQTSTTVSSTPTTTTVRPTPAPVSCPAGFKRSPAENTCIDIDECLEQADSCDSNQECYNTRGSYVCRCKIGFNKEHATGACVDVNECQLNTHDCTVAQRCDNTIGSYLCARITSCGTGYTFNYANGLCEDDDECALGSHSCASLGANFKCRNTLGSYRCDPIRIIVKPTPRPQPTPIRPVPNTNTHFIRIPTRPVPSFPPPRPATITPNANNYHIIRPVIGPPINNYPMISGTRKKCLPGYTMSPSGNCEDIDECKSNPCRRGQECLNFNGRYQCISTIQCKIGYELDDTGEACIDVNECSRGTHRCKQTQICKNGQGFYTCECPPGHHLNKITEKCEDIDECKHYKPCSSNADCVNTIGSYRCHCKEGFRGQGNFCDNIDECKETPRLCEHTCVNTWGSYRCACNSGFYLNSDNRTCTDLDECEKFRDRRLCIGTCVNTPGSYTCRCPDGYYLNSDGRTCSDIDECQQNICRRHDEHCLNTRGGYKCYTITCPPNYLRDTQYKARCRRVQAFCNSRDVDCFLRPDQYSYFYTSLVSKLPLPKKIQIFQLKGPQWPFISSEFSVKVINVYCPPGIERVDDRFFEKIQYNNSMNLYLVKTIQGPQEIQLQVKMQLLQHNAIPTTTVSYIFILVSEHEF